MGSWVHHMLTGRMFDGGFLVVSRKKDASMNMPMKMTLETRYGFARADFGMSKRYGESVADGHPHAEPARKPLGRLIGDGPVLQAG